MVGGLRLPQDVEPPVERLPLAEHEPVAVKQLKQKMTPDELQKFLTMKLSMLAEMIGERHLALFDRIVDRRKMKLKWWMGIGFLIQGLKIACFFSIMTCLIFFRFYTVQHGASLNFGTGDDLIEFFFYDGIFVFFFILLLAIVTEVMMALGILLQHPSPLAMAFAANCVFVLAVILTGCFAGGAAVNVEPISKHLFGRAFDVDSQHVGALYEYQNKYGCCGALGPDDWFKTEFFRFDDFTRTHTWIVENHMNWLYKCYHSNEQRGCSAPQTCCEKGPCMGDVTDLDLNTIILAGKAKNDKGIASLAPIFQKLPGKVSQRGCWNILRNEMSFLLMIIGIAVLILAVLHLLLTVLVVAGILYHSAMGCIDAHMLILRPATKTPLVMFFMWLDGLLLPDDATLTDFSIIEYLKNLDVDEKFAGAEY